MKKIVFIQIVILVALLQVHCLLAQSDSIKLLINFDDAYSQLLKNTHSIKQAQLLEQQRFAEKQAATGLYFPSVSLGANYLIMSEDLHLDLSPVRDAITPLYETLGNYGNFSGVPNPDPQTAPFMPILPDSIATQAVRSQLLQGLQTVENGEWDKMLQKKQFGVADVTFTWPIFTGGKISAANKAAEIKHNLAAQQAADKISEEFTNLVTYYYGICLAEKSIEVRQQVLEGMNQHVSDAEKLEKNGIIARAEKLHAEVYRADAQRELQKAKRTKTTMSVALSGLLAYDKQYIISPTSNLFYVESIASLEYFKEKALENNSYLKQVDSKKQLSKQNFRAEMANLYPTVALAGMYELADKDLSPYVPEWTVGVTVKWNVFDGLSRERKIKAAKLQMQQVDEFEKKLEKDINTLIEKHYNELMMELEQLVSLETSLELGNEFLTVREKAFKEGIATSTEVVDARMALAKVKIERLKAIYDFQVALANLLQTCGVSHEFFDYQKSEHAVYE